MEEERLSAFLASLEPDLPPLLSRIEAEARRDHVPVIRPGMQSFLRTLLAAQRPERILEVGTAVGFSALFMSACAPLSHIDTIESDAARCRMALENVRLAKKEEAICLLCGDADRLLKELAGPYDLIFMDAAKGQYINWLPDLLRLLHSGSILLSDNVLQEGEILESRYLVERRRRTIHRRMREYLYLLTHHPDLTTSILPVGDGAALSVMR